MHALADTRCNISTLIRLSNGVSDAVCLCAAMDPYYILHYTYGMDYTKDGVFTPGKYGEWRFDKRTYASLPPPRNLGMPPPGMPNALVRHLVSAINEASSRIPGWDDYAATGVAAQLWDGKL